MAKVCGCILARDEGLHISRAIRSLAQADEILVLDTGSQDDTVRIARQLGARVVSILWNSDFSEARNRAWDLTECDWIFFLDADEVADPNLPSVLASLLSEAASVVIRPSNLDPWLDEQPIRKIRAVQRARKPMWKGVVGEQLELAPGTKVEELELEVVHRDRSPTGANRSFRDARQLASWTQVANQHPGDRTASASLARCLDVSGERVTADRQVAALENQQLEWIIWLRRIKQMSSPPEPPTSICPPSLYGRWLFEYWRRHVSLPPGDLENTSPIGCADLQLFQGEPQQALDALQSEPATPLVEILRCEAWMIIGQYAKAQENLSTLDKENLPEVVLLRGMLADRLGHADERTSAVTKLNSYRWDEFSVRYQICMTALSSIERLSKKWRFLGEAKFDAALHSHAEWIELGEHTYHAEDAQSAILCFINAIRQNPVSPTAWNNLGVVFHTLSEQRDAEAAFEHAFVLHRNNKEAKENLERIRTHANHFAYPLPSKINTVLVTGHCQTAALTKCLSIFLPEMNIVPVSIPSLKDQASKEKVIKNLSAGASWLVDRHDPSLVELLRSIPWDEERCYHLPTLVFDGFHPDLVTARLPSNAPLLSPVGFMHSAIALWCWQRGLSCTDAKLLFRDSVFQKLGYFNRWSRAQERLQTELEAGGVDFHSFFLSVRRTGVFMSTHNHPRLAAIIELARDYARRLGATKERLSIPIERFVMDHQISGPVFAVYPSIANQLGLKGSYHWKTPSDVQIHGLDRFLEASYAAYQPYTPRMLNHAIIDNPSFGSVLELALDSTT